MNGKDTELLTANQLLVAVGSQCTLSGSQRHLEAGGYCPPCVWCMVCARYVW